MTADWTGWTLAEACERATGSPPTGDAANQFWTMICEGRLVACGRTAPDAPSVVIPAEECRDLSLKYHWANKLTPTRGDGAAYQQVVVYPVLHAPDILDRLDGLPMEAALMRFVVGDPEVRYLGKAAIPYDPDIGGALAHGYGSSLTNPGWPVGHNVWLAGTMDPDCIYSYKRNAYDEVRAYWIAVNDRWSALMGLLRSGAIVAVGDPVREGYGRELLSSIWSHGEYQFDPTANNVLCTNPDPYSEGPSFVPKWYAIMLYRPRQRGDAGYEPVRAPREAGHWNIAKELSRAERPVRMALEMLFPQGIDGISAKRRDEKIIAYLQTRNDLNTVSRSTIKRALAKLRFEPF